MTCQVEDTFSSRTIELIDVVNDFVYERIKVLVHFELAVLFG